MDDSKILMLLRNSPDRGIHEATVKYGGLAKAVAIKILHSNREDVEECIADTFILLWKNIDKVDFSRGTLKGYIACIARNTAINRYNKLKREKNDSIYEQEIKSGVNVEEEVALKSDIDILQDIISDMGEPDKEIFTRRFFLFEKVKDIALKIGLTEKVVENRIYRGRKKLKDKLMERGVMI